MANSPPKDAYVMVEFLPLAYPEFYSVAEQDKARTRLQGVVGMSRDELERERRRREAHPASSVTVGTDNEVE